LILRAAGIDIGSRSIKLVVVEGGQVVVSRIADTTFDPLTVCRELSRGLDVDRWIATGYGRHLYAEHFHCGVVTEIKAVARGAQSVWPTCRTILDVGGQDTKAIALDTGGRLRKFTMNDRCAAGTGRFLEVMAAAMSVSLADLAAIASAATSAEKLSSMCTVFAESEVISLIARGAEREAIALGIHEATATRTSSLVKRVPICDDLIFVGGGALNACLRQQLGETLATSIHVPEQPQTIAALGAALCAASWE
jgi:predicted CoA-substrate-specific enzyme activase